MNKREDQCVFVNIRESEICSDCGSPLDRGVFITVDPSAGIRCLSCADLGHLVFLPSGDATLTRRARKSSKLSAVVLKFSRARKRNERQGILVEEKALMMAERECLGDEEVRSRRRERDALRRERLDTEFVARFAAEIRKVFPGCPKEREDEIAEHACLKHSGRVGKTAASKEFDPRMIELAVRAHARHRETPYDDLLSEGYPRDLARENVRGLVDGLLARWKQGG